MPRLLRGVEISLIDASISNLRHSLLNLTYKNLITLLKKAEDEHVLGFQEYLKSSLYCPVLHKVIVSDFRRFKNSFINNPIFKAMGMYVL